MVRKKLVIALALVSNPKVLLLDECFAALDILTIKMIGNYSKLATRKSNNNLYMRSPGRDLLACVDAAMILSNCKIVAKGTPSSLIKDINAQNAYFGSSFKIS